MAKRKKKDKFPLWLHKSGQWAKTHRKKKYYFGVDQDAALKRYANEWPDVLAGRAPKRQNQTGLTVGELADLFIDANRRKVTAGDLTKRSAADYFALCESVVEQLGKDRLVADLRPENFAKLRARVADRLAPVSVLNFVNRVRVLFKFAFDNDLIEIPVRYGKMFDRPKKKTLRLARAKKAVKLVPAVDLVKMIDAADPQLRAMIYLALNGGLGSTDCAELTRMALAAQPGWMDGMRRKTATHRRFPLWPETVAALEAVAAIRPDAKDPAEADRVFLTRFGQPWVRFNGDDRGKRSVIDSVAQMFAKLAEKCGIKLPSGFYILRHIHRTISDETHDRPAIDLIMGHSDGSMGGHYREAIADERLQAVVDHVRAWLLNGKSAGFADVPAVLPFLPSEAG